MKPDLTFLGQLTFTLQDTQVIKNTPTGTRVIVQFTNVRLTGDRVQADQKGPHAGDWLTVNTEGIALLDIRFTLQTSMGALMYVHGSGKTDAHTFSTGGPMFFFPEFETGDPALAWLNRISVLAKGTAQGNTAAFELLKFDKPKKFLTRSQAIRILFHVMNRQHYSVKSSKTSMMMCMRGLVALCGLAK